MPTQNVQSGPQGGQGPHVVTSGQIQVPVSVPPHSGQATMGMFCTTINEAGLLTISYILCLFRDILVVNGQSTSFLILPTR